MEERPMNQLARVLVLPCCLALSSAAFGQKPDPVRDYPSRPIRIVVGFAPGGTTDITARLLAAHLTQAWGVQVVVDNRTGASGQIGSEIVARATPDGHTLMVVSSGVHTSNLSLYRKLSYDTVKDFAPVTLFAWVSNMIVTHPSSPLNSLQDLIRTARAAPGKLTYASASIGTVGHLSAELLKVLAKIDMVHVPFKGGGPALTAIAGNEVTIMFAALPSAAPFVQAKRIKPLVVTSPRRAPSLPDVPTVAEAGVPGLGVMEWYGMFAPAGTPAPIIDKLQKEVVTIIRKPELASRFGDLGADFAVTTPAEFGKQVASDIKMWAAVIKEAGIRAD
jgi:tripartite-type tricarboxylate transporter receptor subunit TctC